MELQITWFFLWGLLWAVFFMIFGMCWFLENEDSNYSSQTNAAERLIGPEIVANSGADRFPRSVVLPLRLPDRSVN